MAAAPECLPQSHHRGTGELGMIYLLTHRAVAAFGRAASKLEVCVQVQTNNASKWTGGVCGTRRLGAPTASTEGESAPGAPPGAAGGTMRGPYSRPRAASWLWPWAPGSTGRSQARMAEGGLECVVGALDVEDHRSSTWGSGIGPGLPHSAAFATHEHVQTKGRSQPPHLRLASLKNEPDVGTPRPPKKRAPLG